jgi:hypothetical protein
LKDENLTGTLALKIPNPSFDPTCSWNKMLGQGIPQFQSMKECNGIVYGSTQVFPNQGKKTEFEITRRRKLM